MAVNPDDITNLARDIGARLPGTGKERRAAHYVTERLRNIGVPAAMLPVTTPPSIVPVYVSLFAVTAVGVPAARLAPFLGLLIAVFGSGLIVLELINRPLVSTLFASRRTNNILGILPALVNDEIGEPARRVILSAHLDTARGGLLWHHVVVRSFRTLVLVVLTATALIPILLLAYTVRQISEIWIAAWILMALLLVAAIFLAESEWRGPPVAGANDNASGVAALLAIASALKSSLPTHVETWFLFTSGVEAGLVGMNRFLDENTFNPNTTYFINVDHVGSGRVHYTRGEGLLRFRRSSPPLTRLASDIASHHPEWDVTSEVHRLLPTDQYAALNRGYQAVTIMALDKESYLPHWHQSSDTADTVDIATVQTAADLTLALVRRLDMEVRGTSGRGQVLEPPGEAGSTPETAEPR